jgi:DNA-binding CsgD family transcriptional regulator
MEPGARLWRFIELCQQFETANEIAALFLQEMEALGFPYVALVSHVDPVSPPPDAVMAYRYPMAWVDHFGAEQYQDIDPVFDAANRRDKPFRWNDPRFLAKLSREQIRVLAEGREVGVADGVTTPIKLRDALPASCSLVPDSSGVSAEQIRLAQTMSVYAHERILQINTAQAQSDAPRLTKRERECLMMAARGKSDWVISELLGVSERAVNHTIERAKRRLGVSTRMQAIMHALRSGEITLFDVA